MNKSLLSASLFALAIATPLAHAYEGGDFIVRAGAAKTVPHENSGNLKVDGSKDPGTKATLNNDTQMGLAFAYMLTDHFGLELLLATPFQHNIGVKGGGLDGKLADTKQLPPTLSLQYYPMDRNSRFQPYAGLGVNYTMFYDSKLTDARRAEGFSHLKVQNSVGLAEQIGADYMLTDHIMLNAAVWHIDIDTKASVDGPTALDASRTKVNVGVDPWVYMVGVGYKF